MTKNPIAKNLNRFNKPTRVPNRKKDREPEEDLEAMDAEIMDDWAFVEPDR